MYILMCAMCLCGHTECCGGGTTSGTASSGVCQDPTSHHVCSPHCSHNGTVLAPWKPASVCLPYSSSHMCMCGKLLFFVFIVNYFHELFMQLKKKDIYPILHIFIVVFPITRSVRYS